VHKKAPDELSQALPVLGSHPGCGVQQKSVSPESGPLGAQSTNPNGVGDALPSQTYACIPATPGHNVESVDAQGDGLKLAAEEPMHVLVVLSHWSPRSQ
jgi:hypothetical protein